MDGEFSSRDTLESMSQHGSSGPRNLPLEYLRNITNNFSDDQLLGEGGFGMVYKGVLPNGEMVAVKKLNSSMLPGVKDKQFENEAYHLMRLKHPNILLLVGWCSETENIYVEYNGKHICAERSERLLCLEYTPKGNLRLYLSDESSGLTWETRYKIIKGICYGLHYLHEERQLNAPIVHMDLKPANILLDNNMVPKIADFGLSRLFSEEKTWTCTTNRDGTLGYMAPEYINRGLISTKSDIFSLGVIIIEIVTGNRDYPEESETEISSQEFTDLVLKNWRHRLQKSLRYTSLEIDYQQIVRCIQIGLDCVKLDRWKRPTISQVIKMLHETESAVQSQPTLILGQCVDDNQLKDDSELPNRRARSSSDEMLTAGSRVDDNVSKDAMSLQSGEDGYKPRGTISLPSNQVQAEWIEQYEPGVYITLSNLRDGTRDLKRVRFSQRRFDEHQAENWWTENREKVHERYNVKSSERVSSAASAGKKNLSDSVKGGTESAVQSHPTLILGQCVDDNQGEMSSTLSTIEVPTSSSLGAMGPLLWKLDSMLASESHLQRSAKEAIKLLKEDLEEINADLVELSMVERPNYKTQYWMHEVRELSYHIEDCIDSMVQSRAAAEAKVRFSGRRPQLRVRPHVKILCLPKTVKPFASLGLRRTLILSVPSSLVRHPGFLKRFSLSWRHESRHGAPLAQLHQALLLIHPPPLSARIAELRTMLREASKRHERYQLQDCVSSEPRFLFSWNSRAPVSSSPGAAANLLVVVDGMRGKLTSWLIDQTDQEHQQLKVLSIVGPAGVGKTALVKELYRQLGDQFECRAFVRVSRNPDMRRLLGDILAQVQGRKRDYEYYAASTADNLMDSIRSHLQDKRYFAVIDELWDAAAWDIMNIAFPKGNNCSRIIITAEGKDVASKCYYVNNLEMTPLGSLQDSGKIFFDRVFGSEHQCPDQLKDISCMIIRSCGGFPLAITTVASLLASQIDNTELWDYLQQCFVSRLTGVTLEETCKEVVDICYDALPQDLKTCLLYLAMYPEGSTIRKADLLNQWIAEGFITPKEENQTVAESYFAELINRGMIQPEKIDHNDEVLSCTLHHIVFDVIAQKSRGENFITAIDYSQAMPGFSMIARRLTLHFSCAQFAAKPEGLKLSQVRSLAFYGLLKCMPSITKFKSLRVLILEFWGDNYHHNLDLSKLCILFHLRYLKVSSHTVIVLPSKIQRLQSLETLEIDAKVSAVPTDILHLPGLLHLSLPNGTELPDGIGRITSLQTLEHFDLGSNSENNAQSLGELINLQNLHVTCSKAVSDHHLKRNLVALSSSIGKLANLKSLRVGPFAVGMMMFIDQEDMPCTPKLLQRLELLPPSCIIFSRLPTWIGGLQRLRILKIAVRILLSSDIDTLTGLPGLAVLSLYVQKPNAESVVFNSGSLPALKYFKYRCGALRLAFEKAALPNLQRLKLCFNVHRAESCTSNLAGIENLLKLKEITAEIGAAAGAHESDRRAAESALKEATRKHPRFPIHMNVESVDCIEEESTPVGFMHPIPYILGFLALAVVLKNLGLNWAPWVMAAFSVCARMLA